jgi:serine/threonine protein kinase
MTSFASHTFLFQRRPNAACGPRRQKHIQGTPAFMSPELWMYKQVDNDGSALDFFCADVWALGCSLFMLTYGHLPFMGQSLL